MDENIQTHDENEVENGANLSASKTAQIKNHKPLIYDYIDYRAFLQDSLVHIQSRNSKYSATAYVRQAGFGENSRGYFNLIMNGKRNLSSLTILGFARTLKLSEKETFHFYVSLPPIYHLHIRHHLQYNAHEDENLISVPMCVAPL